VLERVDDRPPARGAVHEAPPAYRVAAGMAAWWGEMMEME